MIRRLAFAAAAAVAISAGSAQAQPAGADADPYALPPGYNQVTGYGEPTEAESAADYGDPYGADGRVPGASEPGSTTFGREGYSRSGSSYSSRSTATSQEAYIEGEIDERGATTTSSARYGYQRRFEAFSVAAERSETSSYARREEIAPQRSEPLWNPYDIHLDASAQMGLTGGVEGSRTVIVFSGGGYATVSASASASAHAGARAFAGVRAGHRPGGHGGCGCHR